jgi:hypothetical protein
VTETTAIGPAYDNWDAVLSAMENYLQRVVVDDLVEPETGDSAWSLPTDIGPLPVELRERAERVRDAQNEVVAALERRQRSVGKHIAAIRTVPTGQHGGGSAYLDVTR